MRRNWREQRPSRMFSGAERMRLVAAVSMLVLICLLMAQFRDPSTWRWLVGNGAKPVETAQLSAPKTPPPAISFPEAPGPTDEDRDEAEKARQEFQVVTDGTLQIQREEMEPYDRLVEWVKNQPFDRLYQRAVKGLRYTNLYDGAEKYRGRLVALNLEVRIAEDAGKNRYGVPLYDAWAVTDESRGRLYSLIVLDYPKGMPTGFGIQAKAKFAGYFLKLQGYEPATAKPGQAPEKAPLLIGRLEWIPPVVATPPIDSRQEWTWGLSLLAALGVVLGLNWIYRKWIRRKPPARSATSEPGSGQAIPIEAWLERSSFGASDPSDRVHEEADPPDGNGKAEEII